MAHNSNHCAACGTVGDTHEHHIVPRVHGGRNLPTVYLCIPCHSAVHSLEINVRHVALTSEGLAKAKAEGRRGGNPGIRNGDKAAIQKAHIARAAVHAENLEKTLDQWLPTVNRMRPLFAWVEIAAEITRTTGTVWTGERLRRCVRWFVAMGRLDKALLARRPARPPPVKPAKAPPPPVIDWELKEIEWALKARNLRKLDDERLLNVEPLMVSRLNEIGRPRSKPGARHVTT